MSWTRETPSSSPPFQPIARALIIVITASLSLVAGLIGLLAAMIGLFVMASVAAGTPAHNRAGNRIPVRALI